MFHEKCRLQSVFEAGRREERTRYDKVLAASGGRDGSFFPPLHFLTDMHKATYEKNITP